MAKKSLNVIKSWFKTGLFPTQQQFWDAWDSFFHKDSMIPASQVENLQGLLDQKIDKKDLPDGDIAIDDVSGLRSELDDRVNKIAGKGLSTQDYTTEEKNKLAGIAENANNYQHPVTHPAAMIEESDDKQFVTNSEKLEFQDAYSAMMYLTENVTDDGDTLRKLYDLIQALKGNVPDAGNSLEKVYNLITGITNADKEYADITARDADKANLDNGESVIVNNATADPTVVNGWAIYRFNQTTQSFLKIAEQESIDVDLSNYMKFTDLVTQYLDEPNKPAAASLVKSLKDVVDALPKGESELDHNKLKNYFKGQHLFPKGGLYQVYDSYIMGFFNHAMSYMNHGAFVLDKIKLRCWMENDSNPDYNIARISAVDDNDVDIDNYTIRHISPITNDIKSANFSKGTLNQIATGKNYIILRLSVSESNPNGTIYAYDYDHSDLEYHTGVFDWSMSTGNIDKTSYDIILAVIYFPDSDKTKTEDIVIWNMTDIQRQYDLSEDFDWYGVEWNTFNSESPDLRRIGNLNMHKSLPIQSKIKRCLVWDNGTIHYYLDPNDSTKKEDGTAAVLDGSHGQVMVEMPEFYYLHEKDGYKHRYKISEKPISGYRKIKKCYISAFEASMQRSTSKLSSVVNSDVDYRGGNNNSAWDAAVNSLLGRPITNQTRAEFRTYAQNRGVGWHQVMPYEHYSMSMLAVIEYATFNLQQGINAALTAEGYKQGGLGSGATTANSAEWSDYSGYNPVIPCGHTKSLGNSTGEVDYVAVDFGGAGISRTFKVSSYRGIENPFGHIWKFMDGLNINECVAYATDDVASLADDVINGFELVGLMPSENGYQKDVQDHLLPLPKTVGGGSTTYLCDYYYQNSGWRVARVGGGLSTGSIAGLFNLAVSTSASSRNAYVGARLCFRAD